MAQCKTAVTPVLMHWSYRSHALSHWYPAFIIRRGSHFFVSLQERDICVTSPSKPPMRMKLAWRKVVWWRWLRRTWMVGGWSGRQGRRPRLRGGGYLANFFHFVIFPIFQSYQNAGYLWNVTFIFYKIWMWCKDSNMCFCKIKKFS